MCPMIFTGSGQMGFARVAKTRITYVRSSVAWTKLTSVQGLSSKVTVTFPTDRVRRRNINAEFHPTARPDLRCRVEALFAGEFVRVVAATPMRGDRQPADFQDYAQDCRRCFEEAGLPTAFFAEYIARRFTYSTLGRDHQNAASYFAADAGYRVRLLEFDRQSMLALTKV